MPEYHVKVIAYDSTAVDLLQEDSGLPANRIKEAMSKGAVWLTRGKQTRRLRRAKRVLKTGDELHLYYNPEILSEEPPEPTLVADQDLYSVWDKPFGLRSQGSRWGDHCTVVRWAETQLEPQRSAFTVHRLDRAASGLILVAHSKSMAAKLSTMFRERKIEKHYVLKVHGEFPDEQDGIRVTTPIDGKEAVSIFKRGETSDGVSSVHAQLETGRKHQLRRHLAELGYPVVGDRLYGRGSEDGVDLQLRARVLSFLCPVQNDHVRYSV